jgi:hypothetical protein
LTTYFDDIFFLERDISMIFYGHRKNGYIAIFPPYLDRRENGYIVDFPPGKMAI